MLTEKAKDLYEKINLTNQCVFSDGWVACFKMHNIKRLDVSGELKSVNYEAADKFYYCCFSDK